jgi:RimJ/RimL family protein N-acetyltransferase
MSDVTVRLAALDDAPVLSAYNTVIMAEGLDTIPRLKPRDAAAEREWLAKLTEEQTGFAAMALIEGELVGLLTFHPYVQPGREHSAFFGISVAQSRRGQGVGRALIRFALDEAEKRPGFCRVELDVVPWNTGAIALYESLGFRHEGRRIKAVSNRGTPEDLLLMAKVW